MERETEGGAFMEVSAIMNIYELAMNRTVRQRANSEDKRNQTLRYEYLRQAEKGVVSIFTDTMKPTTAQKSFPLTLSNPVQSERLGSTEARGQQAGISEDDWNEPDITGRIVNVVS
ncbi:hypothetical protein PITCH_A380001 [uncultured Desulfobacterium sp.]|uniref:Uncharacterized protein n=1 Tax=uncultured Desulfobacterium sp. TaxID=201089 RepID=A0A445MZJ7_9BACT|nr:hypothetical protein PITCH_A380001 [uncultured Desulfobacterium sp.]